MRTLNLGLLDLVNNIWNHTMVHCISLLRRQSMWIGLGMLVWINWREIFEILSWLLESRCSTVATRRATPTRHSQRSRLFCNFIDMMNCIQVSWCVFRAFGYPDWISKLRRTELLPPKIHVSILPHVIRFELRSHILIHLLSACLSTHLLVRATQILIALLISQQSILKAESQTLWAICASQVSHIVYMMI